nr:hypothetical protein [Sorangium cellulosum]
MVFISLIGCGGADGFSTEAGSVEAATSALLNHNALNPNALNPNALNPNALDPNALDPSALALNRLQETSVGARILSSIRAPGELGALSRELLRYIVSCALSPSQSFRFSWHDEQGERHEESYPGHLGLAASWSHEPLSASREQWVSACVASRANLAGISVLISSRAAHAALRYPDRYEVEAYPREEGAFWGNLFSNPPRLYACYNEHNIESSRAIGRECAAGHVGEDDDRATECPNIHIVGSCDHQCAELDDPGEYRTRCRNDRGEWSTAVVTTYLR